MGQSDKVKVNVILHQGPFDGLKIDVSPGEEMIIPSKFHRDECGVKKICAYTFRPLMGRYVYDHERTIKIRQDEKTGKIV